MNLQVAIHHSISGLGVLPKLFAALLVLLHPMRFRLAQ
jgi:hypothetical protein